MRELRDQDVIAGQEFRVQCYAGGSGVEALEWYQGRKRLHSSSIMALQRCDEDAQLSASSCLALTIRKVVKNNDDGEYSCKANLQAAAAGEPPRKSFKLTVHGTRALACGRARTRTFALSGLLRNM